MVSQTRNALPHNHDFLELAYISQGSADHIIGNKQTRISKGDYFIVDYNTVHSYRSVDDRPMEMINILFHPRLIDNSLTYCRSFSTFLNHYLIKIDSENLRLDPSGTTFHDEDGRILSYLQTLIEEYKGRRTGFTEMMRSTLIELLICTMRKISSSPSDTDVIHQLTDYIAAHYANPLPLSALAKKYGYSLPYLSEHFKRTTGIGFREYLCRVRMEEACRLLANTDKKMLEIADCVGYSDVNSFFDAFRRVIGRSPGEFRKELRLRNE